MGHRFFHVMLIEVQHRHYAITVLFCVVGKNVQGQYIVYTKISNG